MAPLILYLRMRLQFLFYLLFQLLLLISLASTSTDLDRSDMVGQGGDCDGDAKVRVLAGRINKARRSLSAFHSPAE